MSGEDLAWPRVYDLDTTVHQASDHPRVSGEDGVRMNMRIRISGSPPRERGRPELMGSVIPSDRITPA